PRPGIPKALAEEKPRNVPQGFIKPSEKAVSVRKTASNPGCVAGFAISISASPKSLERVASSEYTPAIARAVPTPFTEGISTDSYSPLTIWRGRNTNGFRIDRTVSEKGHADAIKNAGGTLCQCRKVFRRR